MIKKRYWFWNKRTQLIHQVRVFVDYSDPATNRASAALAIKDIDAGSGDDVTVETSDTGNYTWTAGTDFTIGDNKRTTAESIAEAINSTTNFSADAVTGYPGTIFVYIHYTASGYITSAYSSDTGAWAFYEVNADNGTIRTVYADEAGSTVKTQPFFSNRDGYVSFWIASGSGDYDLDPYKSGVPKDETYYEHYTP